MFYGISTDILVLQELIIKLLGEISAVKSELSDAKLKILSLEAENLELKRQLGQNSKNSHKPPSTDGKIEVGKYPLAVKLKTQYGANILTICNLLTNECRVSHQKTSQLLSDIFACSLNASTIMRANEKLYENLAPIEQEMGS